MNSLGWDSEWDKILKDHNPGSFEIGRVASVHRERYIIKTLKGDFEAEITGNLRFSASCAADFPVVGDWVTHSVFDESLAIIYDILPRRTLLERQAVGKTGEKQLIASNVDYSFIVQSLDHDFNINRLERYLAISLANNILPILLPSKTDLIEKKELMNKIESIRSQNIVIGSHNIPVSDAHTESLMRALNQTK